MLNEIKTQEFDLAMLVFFASYRGPRFGSYAAALHAVRAGDRCTDCGALPTERSKASSKETWSSWRCESCINAERSKKQ